MSYQSKPRTHKIIFDLNKADKLKLQEESEFKENLKKLIDSIHNLLRGSGVTGNEALNDILKSFALYYIEDKITETGSFDLDNIENEDYINIEGIDDELLFNEYKKCLRISHLITSDDLRTLEGIDAINKAGLLLSNHRTTKGIFRNQNFIICKDGATIQKMFKLIKENEINLLNIKNLSDLIGYTYEHFINNYSGGGGKDMGQYFTERPLMRMTFELIDKQDLEDLNIINNDSTTLGDEFCGTFGYPLHAKNFLANKFGINIEGKNMYGVEYNEKTYNYAYLNAMLSLEDFSNIKQGSSFENFISPHLDISTHNVPFGSSMNFNMIKASYNKYKKIYKEKTQKDLPDIETIIPHNNKKNDVVLASQLVLYKTRKMGILIIKDGEETTSKKFKNYRKYMSENCIIKKILKIPSGAFSHTNVQTAAIYFIKKEGKQTENIQFLELNHDSTQIIELCNISNKDLKNNNYSWNSDDYLINIATEKLLNNTSCPMMKLGDIIKFEKKSKRKSSYKKQTGKHNFYVCSNKIHKCDEADYTKDKILIGGGGKFNVHYTDNDFSCSTDVHIITTIDETKYKNKYLYNYILSNKDNLEKRMKGSTIKHFTKTDVINTLIPIPSIQKQQTVIDDVYNLKKQKELLQQKIKELELLMNKAVEDSYLNKPTIIETQEVTEDINAELIQEQQISLIKQEQIKKPKKVIKKIKKKVIKKKVIKKKVKK